MSQTRRQFMATSLAAAAAAATPTTSGEDKISLASWSLVRSFRAGKWTNLDLPRILRDELGIGGLEYVNSFFENPTLGYLQKLKRNCDEHGVTSVLIMVDGEGDTASLDKAERMQAAVAHRKWVDTAHFLGCHAIRCNMRGGADDWKQDKDVAKRAAESFRDILEYSQGSGLNIVIENHGGASSDADVLVALMKEVNDPRFGTLPDFGNTNPGDDPYQVMTKLMPYAKGVSVKAGWALDESHPRYQLEKMVKIAQDGGYHGYWGIESSYGNQRRGRGEQRPAEPALSPEQIWEHDKKGVLLTKAVLERTVLKSS
ncbi:MAG: TIM barrel protein [Bryobacterales bacterium]